jgi:hypothetical protein
LRNLVAELQVFSGRQNPRWVLRPEQADHLSSLVETLTTPAVESVRQLGYHGVVIYAQEPRGTWVPYLRVFDGTVAVRRGPHVRVYDDTASIEGWLLDEAERTGLGDTLGAVFPERRRSP